MNQCGGCGQDFGSLSAFDRHQRWVNGTLICLDPDILVMHRDAHGRWRQDVLPFHVLVRNWMTDEELREREQQAVAANDGGIYENIIQVIAGERNRREDVRRGLGST